MKKVILSLFAASAIMMTSCGSEEVKEENKTEESTPATEEHADAVEEEVVEEEAAPAAAGAYDFTEKGIPVAIPGPADAEIADGLMMGEMMGVMYYAYELKSGMFNIEVSLWDEAVDGETVESMVAEQKADLEEDEEFAGIIEENANGFTYKLDTEYGPDHSFYYVIIKDGKAIEFTTGLSLMDEYTEEHVAEMFAAVQAAQ